MYGTFTNGGISDVTVFTNKDPIWSKKNQCFVLDFKGRVSKTSVKNFILIEKETSKEHIIFGKVGDNLYSLTVTQPFSIFQGFALGICSIASKIGCQ